LVNKHGANVWTSGMRRCAAFAVAAAISLVSGCTVGGVDMDASYVDYDEASADGAVTRGWIPGFVPRSATKIAESHNLDSNRQWLKFHFDPADLPQMLTILKPVSAEDIRFPSTDATRARPWWPSALLNHTPALESDYDVYSYDDTGQSGGASKNYTGFVAIEKSRPVAWYWSNHL